MANMSLTKVPMPEQDPIERGKNFSEVALGYTKEQAVEEAGRCLGCKNKPCTSGCPVGVDIPGFIGAIKAQDFTGAHRILSQTNSLPAVCGRVCPQEMQCEKHCLRALKGESVAIGRLERFTADYAMKHVDNTPQKAAPNGHKVCIVGAGPAGLTCAGDLVKLGYDVTVFEALHVPGGVLMYGIPEFRLPKQIVQKEIDTLKSLGVKIVPNYIVGRTDTVDALFEQGFEAVFIGTGAGLPAFMNIPGENLNCVYSANEYLTRVNLMKAYDSEYDTPVIRHKSVAVVGGGNVAMDAARCAKRMGAQQVYIIYRRSLEEMPARAEEVHHAKEEGIIFKLLTNPVEILEKEGWVAGIKCVEMELGEPDQSGRRRPVEKPNSHHDIEVDSVIIAIGTSPNPLITSATPDLEVNKWGCILAKDETGQTSKQGVFAGGDAVTGAATVILAMGAGKNAAKAMDEYIKNKSK